MVRLRCVSLHVPAGRGGVVVGQESLQPGRRSNDPDHESCGNLTSSPHTRNTYRGATWLPEVWWAVPTVRFLAHGRTYANGGATLLPEM